MKICVNSPLPTIDDILASFKSSLTFPPAFPKLPDLSMFLPSFPSPLLGNLNVPNLETVMTALELQAYQLAMTTLSMIKPIIGKLGIAINAFLPKIPGLPNFNLLDLITGQWEKLRTAVEEALKRGIKFPFLPSPIFPTLVVPQLEIAMTLQAIIANYLKIVITKLADAVKKVTKLFKKMGTPSFPTFPTSEEILAAILAKIPGLPQFPTQAELLAYLKQKLKLPEFPTLADLLAKLPQLKIPNLDIAALLSKLKFPAMPALPMLPNPLVPSFNFPDIELMLSLQAFNVNMLLGLLRPIMDFIKNVLSKVLSFKFPTFCIKLPDPPNLDFLNSAVVNRA